MLATANETGTLVTEAFFTAFGGLHSGTMADRVGFQARDYDPVTGIYYFRGRWYDPQTGRFTAEDLLGFAAGDYNLYRFVGNSPTNHTDPSGFDYIHVVAPHGTAYVYDDDGRYKYTLGTVETIGGQVYVRDGQNYYLLSDIQEQLDNDSTTDWRQWKKGKGLTKDKAVDSQRFENETGCNTKGRYGDQRDVPGMFGDRHEAGIQAAAITAALFRKVGTDLVIQIGEMVFPYERFVSFIGQKGYKLVKGFLVEVKTGKKVAAEKAKEILKEAEKEIGQFVRQSGPIPAPKEIKGIPDLIKVKPKTPVQGGGKLRARWKDSDGNIYEWDYKRGTVEKYNKKGKHLGELCPETGKEINGPVPGRSVEP